MRFFILLCFLSLARSHPCRTAFNKGFAFFKEKYGREGCVADGSYCLSGSSNSFPSPVSSVGIRAHDSSLEEINILVITSNATEGKTGIASRYDAGDERA